jgi:hypothetical protein
MASRHACGTDVTDGPYFGRPRRPTRAVQRAGVFPSAEDIARRADQLFVAGGRRVDSRPECWRRAEDELLDHAARRALSPHR